MDFKTFIKDKKLLTFLLLFGIITIEIFLIPYQVGYFIRLYIPVVIFSLYVIDIIIEYYIKRRFYENLSNTLNELSEKYLITELVNSPSFMEGKMLKNLLEEVDKSMIENVNKYKYMRGRL